MMSMPDKRNDVVSSWTTIARRALWVLTSCAALTLVGGVTAQTPPDGLRQTEVYVAGEGGYHTYRIPSIVATRSGALLAFAEGRQASAADSGNIDLVLKRSTDNGQSWSPLQLLVDNGPNSASNPCAVVDRRTGTVWLLSTRKLASDVESAVIAGTSQETPTVWVMKSEDDGRTWSPPVEITASVKMKGWTWYATGPGTAIQTEDGRLVIPANHADLPDRIHRSHLFFSDDGGRTWTLGASADPGTNESQVVELADRQDDANGASRRSGSRESVQGSPRGEAPRSKRLMLNMRNHPPKPANYRMVATSSDGGRTLSAGHPDMALIEPPAQASILRYSMAGAGERNRLLFSNPASARRERMTVRLSYDEGASWPVARQIYDGPSAYSSLVVLADRTIGVLFERGDQSPYERITFARLTLAWLTNGSDGR